MLILAWFVVASAVGGTMMFQVLATGDLMVSLYGLLIASTSPVLAWLEYRYNNFVYYGLSMVRVYGVNAEDMV